MTELTEGVLAARVEAAVLARQGHREDSVWRFRCPSGAHPDHHPSARSSVEKAARVSGSSRNGAYNAARRGEIPAIRIGKRFVVPKAALEQLLGAPIDGEQQAQGAA